MVIVMLTSAGTAPVRLLLAWCRAGADGLLSGPPWCSPARCTPSTPSFCTPAPINAGLLIWTICARARFFPIWSSFRFWALAAVVEPTLDPVLARAATAVVLLLFCGVAGGRGGRDGGASLPQARPRRAPPRRRPA